MNYKRGSRILVAVVLALALSLWTGAAALAAGDDLVTTETVNGVECVFANGTPIEIVAPDDGSEGALITWTQDGQPRSIKASKNAQIFGGSHNSAQALASTSITMKGGQVKNLIGGGLHKSTCTVTNVVMQGGTVEGITGGGASSLIKDSCGNWYAGDPASSPTQVGTAHVNVSGGTVKSLVFGGGEGISNTDTSKVVIDGGNMSGAWVTAAGSNGRTGSANITVNGGSIHVLQGINRGNVDSAKIDVPSDSAATIGSLYVGGESGDSNVTATAGALEANVMGGTIGKLEVGTSGGAEITEGSNVDVTLDYDPDNVTTAPAHTFGDWATITQPTHTEKGERQRVCSICGFTEKEEIPAASHSFATEWSYDDTAHFHACSCGEKQDTSAHTYGDWSVTLQPTHLEAGERQRVCGVCGYVQKEEVSTVPHSFGTEWLSDKNGHFHICSCGAKQDVMAHTFGNWTVKQPTAEQDGSKKRVCSICGFEEIVSIPKTGLPKTGDTTSAALLIALTGLGTAGALFALVAKKKQAEK